MDVRLMAAVSSGAAGLNVSALCAELGVSRKTFYKWRARFQQEGLAGLQERPRRPLSSPRAISVELEDEIVRVRKALADLGVDNGAESIRYELARQGITPPSTSTIWRELQRRGQIVPQPRKRPKSSTMRFEADRPNELWQIDATQWVLDDPSASTVEIINIIDDHSRFVVASRAVPSTTSDLAWAVFAEAARRYGGPAGCLSDNGLAFSGRLRGFEVTFETNLRALGVKPITARPYHPQTCGKVERFQQTLKKWLRAHQPLRTLPELQAEIDRFCAYYNHQRPHRSLGRVPPVSRWAGTDKATPAGEPIPPPQHRTRVIINNNGVARLNRFSIGVGVQYCGLPADIVLAGNRALVYVNDALVGDVHLDPNRRYQPSGNKPGGTRQPRPT